MKKLFTLLSFLALTSALVAQTYSDDFESYSAGDYMGVESDLWNTWSNAPGTAEDVQVVTTQAYSGTNSINIKNTLAAGGPQDAILNIGNNLSEGVLSIGSHMYITGGKIGYFNLQATPTPGTVWTLNVQAQNGQMIVDEGGAPLVTASYNDDEWFEWEVVANMSFNIWKFYINGELAGTFSSGTNKVSSINIFSIANSDFWVDDIHYDWQEFVIPETNLSALSLTGLGALAGFGYNTTATVRNNGLNEITSFDITLDDNGTPYTQNITGVTLAAGEYMEIAFDETLTPAAGSQGYAVTVSNVNGASGDDYPDDDTFVFQGIFIAPAAGKRAVVEEGTGTWCGYCPRGAVTMDRMSDTYGDAYNGIAVHDSDPMAVAVYDNGLGITSFPGGKVDRGAQLGDGEFEANWIERMQVAPQALVSLGAQYNEETRFLQVVVEMECIGAAAGTYKPGLVIVENGVTGTTSGYNQVNYFSGEDVDLGGYEDLPNPVPASDMVYDHVGRSILPDFNGAEGILPSPIVVGETYAVNFEITLPTSWDINEIHLIGMFYKGTRVDNSFGLTLADAIDIGWYDSGNLVTGIRDLPEPDATIKLYPNPSTSVSYLDLGLKGADEVSVTVLTTDGKTVSSRDYGVLNGSMRLPINTTNYAKGMYFIQIRIGDTQTVRKLMVD